MTRLNITLPDEVAKQLLGIHNKSHFIAMVLKQQFEMEKKNKLERFLTEGYKAISDEDAELTVDWEETDLEKWD